MMRRPSLQRLSTRMILLTVFCVVILCVEGGRGLRTIGLNPSPPSFVHPAKNVTVVENQEVTLMCSVNDLSEYKLAWVHVETQSILSIGPNLYMQIPRISLDADGKSSALTIYPVRAEDRGWYMCQINTNPMTSSRSYLQVLVPPSLEDWSGSYIEAREGAAIQLTCRARAYPPAKTTWRRTNAMPIFTKPKIVWVVEGPDLVFPSVRREDTGDYTCHVDNDVTSPVSRTTHLTVTYAPIIWLGQQLVGTKAGVDATLNCTSEGNPSPKHYWTVNSSNITNNHKYQLREIPAIRRTKLLLTIRNPGKADFTYYACHAVNPTGHADGTIKLYEIKDRVITVATQPPRRTSSQGPLPEPREIPNSSHLPSSPSPINHSNNKVRVETRRGNHVTSNDGRRRLGGKPQIYPPKKSKIDIQKEQNRTGYFPGFLDIINVNYGCSLNQHYHHLSPIWFVGFFFLVIIRKILGLEDWG